MDSVLCIVGAGFFTHLVFKRSETHEPLHVVLLLFGFPAALTYLCPPSTHSLISAGVTTFSTFWITLATSIVLYRLSPWHPLAKYPGPVICKISKFWFAFLALGGKQHMYYYELHRKYGDFVRVGPNELSIIHAAAISPLMGPAGLPKGPFWDGRFAEAETVRSLIALRDNKEHHRRRRPWNRAFSTAALKGYESMITNRSVQLSEALAEQKGVVDLSKWISFFAYDFMYDLAFGGGVEMIRDGDVDGLWHLIEAGQKIGIFMSHVPWLGALSFRFPSLGTDLQVFRAHAKRQAANRVKKGSAHKDLFHYLMDEDGVSGNTPTPSEAVSDGGLAIIAGSDTISSAISNLFYLLLTNPEKYKRLQAEIDELGHEVMDYGKQGQLGYLNGAINESLRLYPPLLSGSQRGTQAGSGGRMIEEHFIPERTTVLVPHYAIHRDPRYFSPLPESFVPERWLPREDQLRLEPDLFKNQDEVVLRSDCFIPFSVGPFNCVGKNVAWMEMRMVVCLVMQRFEMRLVEGYQVERWEEDMSDYFVMVKGELPVVLTPRK